MNNNGTDDYWLVKLNAEGVKTWDRVYGSTAGEALEGGVATADGGYLLYGYSSGPTDGNKTAASKGGSDYWWCGPMRTAINSGMLLMAARATIFYGG